MVEGLSRDIKFLLFPLGWQRKKRAMHKREPALSKGGGTTKLSETLKIQAVGAGFLAKSNLCSSEAELEGVKPLRKLTEK